MRRSHQFPLVQLELLLILQTVLLLTTVQLLKVESFGASNFQASLNIDNSSFYSNEADTDHGLIIFTSESTTHIANTAFDHNVGSFYAFNSNLQLTLSGYARFENYAEPSNKITGPGEDAFSHQAGGAVTSFQSTVTINGAIHLLNNQAKNGGAILATESIIMIDASIISSLFPHDGGFGEGQQIQSVERNCTNMIFNVFSPHGSGTMNHANA